MGTRRAELAPGVVRGMFHTAREDGRVRCDVCPRQCLLHDGQRGFCFVREARGTDVVLTAYGRSTGFCLDPIEKKPLNHFYPGSSVLSFGTAGCNLGCRFCQNWDISKARETERMSARAYPDDIAEAAAASGAKSVAFTYNDPVIFMEYALDTADACHERGIQTVAVTAGYMAPEARRAFYAKMDAANIDLKAFTERFYEKLCFAALAPVLETLEYVKRETTCWLELTTLLIPGENDSEDELARLTAWVAEHLGPDTPLHFSAFHPDFKLLDHQATPVATLERARRQAQAAGLHYVYTGNVHDPAGQSTYCPSCKQRVIERDGYDVGEFALRDGACASCGYRVAGHFDAHAGHWGSRRAVVSMPKWDPEGHGGAP